MFVNPKLKSLLKRLVTFMITVAVVGFVLNIVADNPYSHRVIRAIISEKVKEETLVDINFQAIKVSLFPLGFDLFGMEITPRGDPASKVFSSSQLKARVSLWSIIIGEPKLGLVELRNPEVSYPLPTSFKGFLPENKNQTNIPDSKNFNFESLPINNLHILNGRLSIELPPEKQGEEPLLVLQLQGLNSRFSIAGKDEVELYLFSNNIFLKTKDLKVLEETEFETDLIVSKSKIHKSPYRLKSRFVDLGGIISGDILNSSDGGISKIATRTTVEGDADTGLLDQIFDIPNSSGRVEGNADVRLNIPIEESGTVGFLATAHVKSKDATLQGFRLRESEADLQINLDQIEFENGSVEIQDKRFGGFRGSLKFNDTIDYDFYASPKGLPLTELLSSLTVDFDQIDTTITSNSLRVWGRGKPFRLQASAIADFDDLTFPAITKPNMHPSPTCRLGFNLIVDQTRALFDGTRGQCFQHAEGSQKGIVPSDEPTPPLDALSISPIEFTGETTFNNRSGMKLDIKSPKFNFALLSHALDNSVLGLGSMSVSVAGPYNNIAVTTEVRARDVSYLNVELDRVSGSAQLSKGNQISWSDLNAIFKNNGAITSSQGIINLDEELSSEFQVSATEIPRPLSESITATLGMPGLSFEIQNMDLSLSGPLKRPALLIGDASFFGKDITYQGNRVFDRVSADVKSSKSGIKTNNLTVTANDFQQLTQLELKRENGYPLHTSHPLSFSGLGSSDKVEIRTNTFLTEKWREARQSSDFFIDHLQSLPIIKDYASKAQLMGRLNASANLQGTLLGLDGNFKVRVDDPRLMGSHIAPITAEGIINKNKLDIILSHSGSALSGRFSVDLNSERLPYNWYFSAKRLDLRALASPYFSKDPRNYIYVNGEWTMEGELTNWWRSKGSLKISDIKARFLRDVRGNANVLTLEDEGPVEIIMQPNSWKFKSKEAFRISGDRVLIEVGMGRTAPPENLDIKFSGYLELSLIKNLYQQIESATGMVGFDGRITGPANEPNVELTVTNYANSKEPLSLGITKIRPPLKNIQANIRLARGIITINSFTADKGNGKVTASGQWDLINDPNIDTRIDIGFRQAALVYQVSLLKSFDVEVSGDIMISGDRKPYLISGDVTIDRARSTREFDLREQIIGALQRRELDQSVVPEEPFAKLDLRINADKSIEIYNRTIQSVLSANILLQGNNTLPVVYGQVEINKGMFAYKYRRDFRITQGIMTFDDPVKPDPRIDILGVAEISSYRVYMAITGRASDPKVDLSIDPPSREDGTPLTKLDILVLMSTGSLPEPQQNRSAAVAAQTEALNILVGRFEEPVEKLFDLSGQKVVQRVYIDTYAGQDGPTPRLNLPLNLHKDWDVIFRVDENNRKVSLGYTVNDNISLSGSVDSQSESSSSATSNQSQSSSNATDTGVDLRFRFSFP